LYQFAAHVKHYRIVHSSSIHLTPLWLCCVLGWATIEKGIQRTTNGQWLGFNGAFNTN